MRFVLHLEAILAAGARAEATASVDTALATQHWIAEHSPAFPGLTKAIFHTLAAGGVSDPYHVREATPQCVLQLYFDELDGLEAACVREGPVSGLLAFIEVQAGAMHTWTQQTMAVRTFGVPEPNKALAASDSGAHCTYLVGYPGPAEDLHVWLRHYIDHHAPIMVTFPGIREVEVFTRVDSPNTLDVERVDLMQRNKVVFDSPAALDRALASEVRHAMRKDSLAFPPFSGGSTHYPMASVARRYG